MDWLTNTIEHFEHMPADRAVMLIVFVALLTILVLIAANWKRDSITAASNKGQIASTVTLAETLQDFIVTFNGLTEVMQQQEKRNQERFEIQMSSYQKQFDNGMKIMADVKQERDAKIETILTGIAEIPPKVEGGMLPKFEGLEKFVTDRLDEFEARLTKKIEGIPESIIAVFQNAVKQTKQEIIGEIKADTLPIETPETKPESSEPITPIIDNVPAVEPVSEVKPDGNTL